MKPNTLAAPNPAFAFQWPIRYHDRRIGESGRSTAKMNPRRSIDFEIRHQDQRVTGGSFVISSRVAVSRFDSDLTSVVIEHCLIADGTASMELEMHELEHSQSGGRWKRVLRTGISMGSESGDREPDSVMLGEEHELIYKTHWLA